MPREQVIIMQNMQKAGIKHGSIRAALQKYVETVSEYVGELGMADLLSFVQIINQFSKLRDKRKLYDRVFDCIVKRDKISPSKLKYLLSLIKGCGTHATWHVGLKKHILKYLVSLGFHFICFYKKPVLKEEKITRINVYALEYEIPL